MSKAKIISVCGMCSAVATLCLVVSALPFARWLILLLAMVASLAIVVPMLAFGSRKYTLLCYAASSILGIFFSIQFNLYMVVPIVTFCMPFAIVKVCAESFKVTAKFTPSTVEDPFGQGEDKTVVEVQMEKQKFMPVWLKWVLYYVLLEVGLVLTALCLSLFVQFGDVWQTLTANGLVWVIVGIMQLAVIPLDLLFRGCLVALVKILRKSKLMR